MVFIDLSSDSFKEFFLFPTLVFYFAFDNLSEFSAVFRIGSNEFELGSFFFCEGFRRDGKVVGIVLDLFEDVGFKLLVLLIADEFELSSEEANLSLVPLERAEDVLIELYS